MSLKSSCNIDNVFVNEKKYACLLQRKKDVDLLQYVKQQLDFQNDYLLNLFVTLILARQKQLLPLLVSLPNQHLSIYKLLEQLEKKVIISV